MYLFVKNLGSKLKEAHICTCLCKNLGSRLKEVCLRPYMNK